MHNDSQIGGIYIYLKTNRLKDYCNKIKYINGNIDDDSFVLR